MCSAGLRRGAIPSLKLKDLDEINQHDVYKITVYKKEQEQYTTFCTPECRKHIGQYLAWRERLGERLQPNTPIIREEFDTMSPMKATRPKSISEHTISYLINNLLDKTGVRPRMANGGKRTELMQTHGFRKFFETTCISNGMNESYVESVMGHKNGLKNAYFKPTDDQILEGNDKTIGFVGAMPFLTINPTDEENERLRKQVRELTPKSDEIQAMKAELKERREQSEKLGLAVEELRATMRRVSKAKENHPEKRRKRKEI
jgi:hypothetical protein